MEQIPRDYVNTSVVVSSNGAPGSPTSMGIRPGTVSRRLSPPCVINICCWSHHSEHTQTRLTFHSCCRYYFSPLIVNVKSHASFDNEMYVYFGLHPPQNSRDSSVGIALGYRLDDRGSRIRFPAGAGNFSLHHRVQNGSGAHPASYPVGTGGSFPGGKAAEAWSWPLTSN
jgi:hypothetical protein